MKKAAIVTGASSGIGAATAQLFSEKGYFVFLLGRNEDRLHEVALHCRNGASLLKADITNEAQLNKYSQHLFERPDVDIEVLVNNAGIYERNEFETSPLDTWRKQFETNLFGTVDWTQRILPLFLKRKDGGSIVNVSSTLGLKPVAGTSAYSASKAAMINWTQALALELAPKKIRVNCVCPGIIDTPLHSFSPEARESLKGMQPLARVGTAQEVAEAIYFLGSPLSSWTTGAILSVDGGINLT